MGGADWSAVDVWIGEKLIGDDSSLQAILDANAAAGLPAIDVSPAYAKLLHLLVSISGARRVLEVGTLGGYSTAWMARALPEEGQVVTLEVNADTAEVARANLERAGVADLVEVRVGPALHSLRAMIDAGEPPFDFVFLDADKENNANYLHLALELSRPGTIIVCDNVIREGRVIEAHEGNAAITGTRAFFDELGANPRLSGTAIQTVGLKGWDGFSVAVVEKG